MAASDPHVIASIVIFTQILESHERSRACGEPLLTETGVCHIRQSLVNARSRADGEALVPPLPLLPFWDAERRQLWLGTSLLKEFSQPASNQVAILAAFQVIGWAMRQVHDPLPSVPEDVPGDARVRLRETVKNLNRGMPKGTIHFWRDSEQNWVRWDFIGRGPTDDFAAEGCLGGLVTKMKKTSPNLPIATYC